MVQKCVFLFIACSAPILPSLSRFFFGIVFALAFCVSFFALLGIKRLIVLSNLKEEFTLISEILALIVCASLYCALVRLISPISYLALEFFLYAVPFICLLFSSVSTKISEDSTKALTMGFFPPIFSLVREILYFGTVSFPILGENYSFEVFSPGITSFTKFLGSLPGSLILTGIVLWMWNSVTAKRLTLE